MPNSRILEKEFDYFEPRTIEEALSLLRTHQEKAKLIAGGTDLLVSMKIGRLRPDCLINISKIPALRFLIGDEGLRIGALTSFRELERSLIVKERYTALYEAARAVTSVQIKNMGTIGGNLCNASPAADSAPPLIVFGGKVRLLEMDNERIFPLEEFFVDNGVTLISSKEILTEIQIPKLKDSTGSAFIKIGRVAADLAKISIAVMIEREGDIFKDCRIAMGGVARIPLRLKRTEEILRGRRFDEEIIKKAGIEASEEIQPRSRRSTPFYKKEVTKILLRDAVLLAWRRTGKA